MALTRPMMKRRGKRLGAVFSRMQNYLLSVRMGHILPAMSCMNVIDTNIWIYSHDARDPQKQAVAQGLIASLRALALPWQVGCEFIAASRKLVPLGFDETKAWSALAN